MGLIIGMSSGWITLQAYGSYSRRRNQYLARLSELLYSRTVATDRGVLYVLMVRANEQQLRRCFLIYSFILRLHEKQKSFEKAWGRPAPVINCVTIEPQILQWLKEECQLSGFKSFSADSAVDLLEQFGVVTRGSEDMSPRLCSLRPLPIKDAIEVLMKKRVDSFVGSVKTVNVQEIVNKYPYHFNK